MRYLKLIAICAALTLTGCSGKAIPAHEEAAVPEYRKIAPEEAKRMIDEGDVIILDVRTESEYDEGHIEGALLIPDYELANKAAELLPDIDAIILVYCRAGMRSRSACETLVGIGYTAVYDCGGITDWPYGIV